MTLQEYLNEIGIYQRYHKIDENRIPELDSVKKYCLEIEKNIQAGRGLLIMGTVGVGKTSMLSYIAQQIYNLNQRPIKIDFKTNTAIGYRKYSMSVLRATQLYKLFFTKNSDLSIYETCNLFGLDDFGTEYNTDFPMSLFEDFVETRYSKMLATIITTNFSPDKIKQLTQYERIIDRWRETTDQIVISSKYKSQRR